MTHLQPTLGAMDLIVAIFVLIIGFAVGFVAGVRNADSKKLKAAVAAANLVKDAVKKD